MLLDCALRALPLQRRIRIRSALVVAALVIVACGRSALYGGTADETVHPRIAGSRFRVIAVIAGNDSKPDLNLSAGLRAILRDSGWTALPAPGRWESELDATADVCSRSTFQGVLVVLYDRVTLRACPDREIAYEIDGGADLGLRGMASRLMAYLRTGRADSTSTGRRRISP